MNKENTLVIKKHYKVFGIILLLFAGIVNILNWNRGEYGARNFTLTYLISSIFFLFLMFVFKYIFIDHWEETDGI